MDRVLPGTNATGFGLLIVRPLGIAAVPPTFPP
jgi:hypothetical protein